MHTHTVTVLNYPFEAFGRLRKLAVSHRTAQGPLHFSRRLDARPCTSRTSSLCWSCASGHLYPTQRLDGFEEGFSPATYPRLFMIRMNRVEQKVAGSTHQYQYTSVSLFMAWIEEGIVY